MGFDRCPAAASQGMAEFLDAYIAQLQGDGWPAEGSRAQQAEWYVRAKALADAERSRLEQRPAEAIEKLSGR